MTDIEMSARLAALKKCIASGTVGAGVIEHLWHPSGFIPKETELWDYKETVDRDDTVALAKTVKHIVSFHNTYGGYIVYGVKEVEDGQAFVPVGIDPRLLDLEQLKAKIHAYTGRRIDVTFCAVAYHGHSEEHNLGLLHVPMRSGNRLVEFIKDGPLDGRKPLFSARDVYFRSVDNSVPAKTADDFAFLMGQRRYPSIEGDVPFTTSAPEDRCLDHNLPDSKFICPQFVGRDDIINDLWKWLADEFNRTRLLAGDGGKGKTSIAYQFATQVCTQRPADLERVIWLTGKTQQFFGITNDYRPVPETHFTDFDGLVRRLCTELAATADEVIDVDIQVLKSLLREHLSVIPSLVILDNLDALTKNEQKAAIELTLQFGGTPSRFLLTSRENFYSPELATVVPGLRKEDFAAYVKTLQSRFSFPDISSANVDALFRTSSGSPLFAESILRLMHKGLTFDRAIADWKGKSGEAVRHAALMNEIKDLAQDSRRVLYVVAIAQSLSVAELHDLLGLDAGQLEHCIDELKALFLIDSPAIIESEPRFSVSPNTAILIVNNRTDLLPDPTALEAKVRRLTDSIHADKKRSAVDFFVGAAVKQANALLRQGAYASAMETVASALKAKPHNRDLLLMQGRCYYESGRSSRDIAKLGDARAAFRRAYDANCRKEILYDMWYRSELLLGNFGGAYDVAAFALHDKVEPRADWLAKSAEASWKLARRHLESMHKRSALEEMTRTCDYLRLAARLAHGPSRTTLLETLGHATRETWRLAHANADKLNDFIEAYDIVRESVTLCPPDFEFFELMITSIEGMMRSRGGNTSARTTAVFQRLADFKKLAAELHPKGTQEQVTRMKERVGGVSGELA
jgi:tetratricopeptide (TPR) repeat protein